MLNDETALLILALLERNGLATEDELINDINFEQHKIKQVLVALQMNQLISYGSNYVRLTTKGKNIIDRFDLLEPVISDLLDDLGYKGKEKTDFEHILIQYRNSSFDFYQNSLCTIKTWKNLANNILDSEDVLFSQELLGGMRSFLLRDIRNWWAHSHQSESTLNKISKEIRVLICSPHLDKITSYKKLSSSKKYTLVLLKKLEQQNIHADIQNPIELKAQPLVSAFHLFQYTSEPFIWYDDLCEALPNIPNKKIFENKNIFLKTFKALLEESRSEHNFVQEKEIHISHRWQPTKQQSIHNNDVFEMLTVVSNIADLSSRTGVQEENLKSLLTEIRDKCNTILGTSGNAIPDKKTKD